MNKDKSKLTFILIVLLLIISIGYAALSTIFKINSEIGLGKVSFNVIFANVTEVSTNATVNESAHISDEDNKEITFKVYFDTFDKYYTYTTDIVNESTLPVKIKSMDITGISDSARKLISYKLTYTDTGKEVKIGDYIGPELTRNITVDVRYQIDSTVTNEDLPTESITVAPVLTIDYENGTMEQYLYGTLAGRLTANKSIYSSDSITFTNPASSSENQGLYVIESTRNSSNPIYFYRGGTSDVENHVVFANYCWRIIRTTATGGVKMIYNGALTDLGCPTSPSTSHSIGNYAYSNTSWDWQPSNAKQVVDAWYAANLFESSKYLEDTPFCNDNKYTNGSISLECNLDKQYSVANGKNTYPIGLITAEEATLCGLSQSQSTFTWLYTSAEYWTMSGSSTEQNKEWISNAYLGLSSNFGPNHSFAIRPVVSLKGDLEFTRGNGKNTNPYIVDLDN